MPLALEAKASGAVPLCAPTGAKLLAMPSATMRMRVPTWPTRRFGSPVLTKVPLVLQADSTGTTAHVILRHVEMHQWG